MTPSDDRHETPMSQIDRFKQAARQIEADEDEAHWETRLKAIARQKPKDAPEKSE
jgi:hypothetical protein